MRLIDADKIPNYAIAYTVDGHENEALQRTRIAFWEDIRKMPTVEARPQGKWIGIEYDGYANGAPVYDVYECSICKEEHYGEFDTLTNFCPECGADMRQEVNKNA